LEKLAYENDISKGYLSNLENGNRLPSLSMLLRISRILGLEPKDFM
jgi:transcriptional regulator with XRE-family HTH domain